MKRLAYDHIINIISLSVKRRLVGWRVSNTTRGAVASWAKTLAGELGGFDITVNNVLPGFIGTDRLHELIADRAKPAGAEPKEMEGRFVEQVPAGRFGQPEDIGEAVRFGA